MVEEHRLFPKTELVGLIPAAGHATRISPLPCSKELFPIGFIENGSNRQFRPKVACEYLLDSIKLAGAKLAHVIIRSGKWDLLAFFKSGHVFGIPLSYLIVELPYGVPYTIDTAFPVINDREVAFGFPDIIFTPADAFIQLRDKLKNSKAAIVLGLFPATDPSKMDMVEIDEMGRIRSIDIKPAQTRLKYTWIIAVWNAVFTQFLHTAVAHHHEKLISQKMGSNNKPSRELYVGDIIQDALCAGIAVGSVIFDHGNYIDIGTPEDLKRATNHPL